MIGLRVARKFTCLITSHSYESLCVHIEGDQVKEISLCACSTGIARSYNKYDWLLLAYGDTPSERLRELMLEPDILQKVLSGEDRVLWHREGIDRIARHGGRREGLR